MDCKEAEKSKSHKQCSLQALQDSFAFIWYLGFVVICTRTAVSAAYGTVPGPQIRVHDIKYFFYFSTHSYVVGTQTNRLTETVLLSTQNTCLN